MVNKQMLGDIFHQFMGPSGHVTYQIAFFETEKSVFRVTRKLYKGKPNKKQLELVVTYGKPNFRERILIKKEKKNIPFTRATIVDRGKKTSFFVV